MKRLATLVIVLVLVGAAGLAVRRYRGTRMVTPYDPDRQVAAAQWQGGGVEARVDCHADLIAK